MGFLALNVRCSWFLLECILDSSENWCADDCTDVTSNSHSIFPRRPGIQTPLECCFAAAVGGTWKRSYLCALTSRCFQSGEARFTWVRPRVAWQSGPRSGRQQAPGHCIDGLPNTFLSQHAPCAVVECFGLNTRSHFISRMCGRHSRSFDASEAVNEKSLVCVVVPFPVGRSSAGSVACLSLSLAATQLSSGCSGAAAVGDSSLRSQLFSCLYALTPPSHGGGHRVNHSGRVQVTSSWMDDWFLFHGLVVTLLGHTHVEHASSDSGGRYVSTHLVCL